MMHSFAIEKGPDRLWEEFRCTRCLKSATRQTSAAALSRKPEAFKSLQAAAGAPSAATSATASHARGGDKKISDEELPREVQGPVAPREVQMHDGPRHAESSDAGVGARGGSGAEFAAEFVAGPAADRSIPCPELQGRKPLRIYRRCLLCSRQGSRGLRVLLMCLMPFHLARKALARAPAHGARSTLTV